MPEALAWVAWASNDIERRTSNFRLHRHLHSLTTYCKVQGWRRVVQGQTVRQTGTQARRCCCCCRESERVLDTTTLRLYATTGCQCPWMALIPPTTTKSCFVREGKSLAAAETNEPVGLEGHAALSIIKCLFFTGHGNIIGFESPRTLFPHWHLSSLYSRLRW